jgi:hypothetical protein
LPAPNALGRLIARARRRALWNLVSAQLMVGFAAALAGAIFLLLLGSDILDWYWLVALFAAGTAISAWRTVRRLPSQYSVAQSVDARLGLHDALSTALHFERSATSYADPNVVAVQRAEAESAASSIEPSTAWPLLLPKQTYAAAGLLFAVVGLGILRYGTHGSLDLRAPLISAVTDFFWAGNKLQAQAKQPPRQPGDQPPGIALDQSDAREQGKEPLPDDLLNTVETPDVNAEGATSYSEKAERKSVQAKGDGNGEQQEGAEDSESASGQSRDAGKNAGKEAGNDSAQGGKQGTSPQNSADNSSLMDKMRDAMSNLLSKLKIPQQSQPGQSGKSNQSQQGKQQRGESGSGEKGEKGKGQQQSKGSPSDDADSGEEGQGDQQTAQAGQGKSGDQSSDSKSNDPNSGVGKQDGNKDIRDAEQAAAMGKLSEIYGKRAQNMTGEIMVEVNSGKQQQLRTAYSNRGATHRESGGEIHRDEVPLAYQDYVQQYFEKVRAGESKPAAAPLNGAAPAAAPAPARPAAK